MPSFTPLRRTYSAVSPSISSSDDILKGNTKEIIVQSSTSTPRTIPRHSFLIRTVIFVLLELGFIALVSAASHKPIFLHVSLTNSEVKGGFTAITIVWHTLAVYIVKDILLSIFSAEWTAQYDRSQTVALQELDIVSRLTAGFIDRAKHCVSERATLPFRLSFLSSILLILLNGLGPSAISVDHVPYHYPSTIQVANLTMLRDLELISGGYANAIVQIELILNYTTVGFSPRTPNILIPWPSPDSMSENMTIRYESDVIDYDFSCSWEAPSVLPDAYGCIILKDSSCFRAHFNSDQQVRDSSITPLQIFSEKVVLPLAVFLFVGRNGTLPSYLNLEDIPHTLLPCNTTQNPTYNVDGIHQVCDPLLMSALVCDPQLRVLPANVTATGFSLEATISPGDPVVKNIPTSAAISLFATSLLSTTANDIYETEQRFTNVALQLFFPPYSSFDYVTRQNPLKPLPLDMINQNMNKVLVSSAKPYLSGHKRGNHSSSFASMSTVNTSAVVEVQKMALVGNKPFVIASIVTVGLLVVLLGAIVASTRPEQLEVFELENIVRKLQ